MKHIRHPALLLALVISTTTNAETYDEKITLGVRIDGAFGQRASLHTRLTKRVFIHCDARPDQQRTNLLEQDGSYRSLRNY
jgi:hypothetical protein